MKKKIIKGIFIIVCVLLAITLGGSSLLYNEYEMIKTTSQECQTLSFDNREKFETCVKNKNSLSDEYAEVKAKYEDLSARLANIKDRNDLLKRDIILYIEIKYQHIPDVLAKNIAENVVEICSKEKMSPELVMGIIQVESSFNPMAISNKNARGLMQVMPMWAKEFKLRRVNDLHNVDINILSGIKVLKIHIKEENGNLDKGLYRYVNKDKTYADSVYNAIGKFVSFRITIDNNGKDNNQEGDTEENDDRNDKTTGKINK